MLGTWDIVLFGVAAMIAVRTLLGLMQKRRDRLVNEVQQQFDAHQEAAARQERLDAKKKKKQEAA